jgi:hypothetical protein
LCSAVGARDEASRRSSAVLDRECGLDVRVASVSYVVVGGGAVGWGCTLRRASAERDELRELVEHLPEDQVPAVLSEARRHLAEASSRSWPPAFFGAGSAGRGDVAERAEELLDDGFGRST